MLFKYRQNIFRYAIQLSKVRSGGTIPDVRNVFEAILASGIESKMVLT